jgi:hypothetical protein
MISWMVLSLATAFTIGLTQTDPPAITLDELTVPIDRLPAGCALSPAASAIEGNKVSSGLWAGLPIPTNPWTGHEGQAVSSITERLAPSRVSDGPPLTQRESARFRSALPDGVEDGYAAIYLDSSSTALVVVYGLAFRSTESVRDFLAAPTLPHRSTRGTMTIGRTVVAISGDGPCFHAIEAHLRSLAK